MSYDYATRRFSGGKPNLAAAHLNHALAGKPDLAALAEEARLRRQGDDEAASIVLEGVLEDTATLVAPKLDKIGDAGATTVVPRNGAAGRTLSDRFADVRDLLDFVAPMDASHSTALARLFSSTTGDLHVRLCAGVFLFAAAVTLPAGRSLYVEAAGPGRTTVNVSHAGTWLTCPMMGLEQTVTVRGLRFLSTSPTGTAGVLNVSYPVSASSSYTSVSVRDVEITSGGTGATAASTFVKPIVLSNCWSVQIERVQCKGRFSVPGVAGQCLVDLSECFDVFINRCAHFYADALVYQSGYCEGIRFSDCTAIGSNHLIKQAPAGIVQRNGQNLLGLWLNGGEVNTQQGGIKVAKTKGAFVNTTQWTPWGGTPAATPYAAYDLTDVQSFVCSNDVFVGSGYRTNVTAIKARLVSGTCGPNIWTGTMCEGGVDTAVDFGPGTYQNAVLGLRIEDGTVVIDNGVSNSISRLTSEGTIAWTGSGVMAREGSAANLGWTFVGKGGGGWVYNNGNGTLVEVNQHDQGAQANYPAILSGITGYGVSLAARGSDPNIDVILSPKGTGKARVGTNAIFHAGNLTFGPDFVLDPATGVLRLA